MYSTWQAFSQALLVDSPLLSYIVVRHVNFVPPRFTIGEARELGLRYTCSDELAPLQDESIERVSQHRWEQAHVSIQLEAPVQPEALVKPEALVEPKALVQEAKETAVESVSSSKTESDQGHDMVTRRTMTISRFMPGARPIAQQQEPQGRDQTPPPSSPPSNRT